MKIKYRNISAAIMLFCLISLTAAAQIPNIGPASLHQKIKNKTTVQDIMKEVEAFYKIERENNLKEGKKKKENEYFHWKRWEYYANAHSGPNGTFYNTQKVLWDVHENIQANEITNRPASPLSPTTPDWLFSGPFSTSYVTSPPSGLNGLGRCDRIAFHPTDPNTIFVGTPFGGLWKTSNLGTTWSCLTSYLPIAGVSGIVVDWSNPNTIYILTGNGDDQSFTSFPPGNASSAGVFKTTDGGINWHQLTVPWSSGVGPGPYQLKQSPRFANKLLLACTEGLYYSNNRGFNWSRISATACTDVDYVPGTDTVYCAFRNNRPIYRSNNGGAIWANVSFGADPNIPMIYTPNRISLAVRNINLFANTELVYIFAGPVTSAGKFNGLYKTNSSGYISLVRNTPNLFDMTNSGLGDYDQSAYDNCITVNPFNANLAFTGGAAIFKTLDGFNTVFNSGAYSENEAGGDLTKYVHGDIHDLAYNPLNNYLYAAGDGGISYSTDHGVSWINISSGLGTSMFYDIAGLESKPYDILSGLQDNGNKYRSSNTGNFIHLGAFDGYNAAISPSNPLRGYYSNNGNFQRTDNLGSGSEMGIVPTNVGAGQDRWRMETDEVDGDFLYASPENSDSIFTSNNGGTTWFRKQLGNCSRSITKCPSNINRMYIIGGISPRTLRRTDNQGVSWSVNMLTNPGLPAVGTFAYDVEVSPVNSNNVFLGYASFDAANKVFFSINAGASWINITYNLPNLPVLTMAVDMNDNVYVGNDYGVFVKLNGQTSWYFYSNKLPRTPVNDLLINRTFGTLYAATFGRGIWQTNVVNSPCSDAFYFITGNVTGERFYEAGVIWSNANMDTLQGTRVSFKVTDSIKLINNFHATDGVKEFRAYTGPCGSGYPVLNRLQDTTIVDISKISLPSNAKEGNYPYGTIRVNNFNTNPHIVLHAKKEGNFTIRISNEKGEYIKSMYKLSNVKIEKRELPLIVNGLPKGFYYLHLLFNDMLVQYQEMEVH